MAHLACYEFTQLPIEIIDILENDISEYNLQTDTSLLINNKENKNIRNSNNAWIPESHWIAGWLWYNGTLQYTHYGAGQFYNWHRDDDIDTMYTPEAKVMTNGNIGMDQLKIQGEMVRKLSFSLQLSAPEDYIGGELEFIDNNNKPFLAPKQRGTMVVFDSRLRHRVRKVKSGLRKSIVGWVLGPRWK